MATSESSASVLTTSALLMSASNHILARCWREDRPFRAEKSLKQGQEVTGSVLFLSSFSPVLFMLHAPRLACRLYRASLQDYKTDSWCSEEAAEKTGSRSAYVA
eukprot:TRINITY_DN13432_c0_g1_i1.p1 TRINITY_DN13432_c0_g1~~TRINITY_DN13432_c0_g1_i1.p1  ORF type:complete len:104 (-),score=0.55 TRINITY_DN13432_c0_g1_i1:384-695(-)